MTKTFFLSHSSKDKHLVKEFMNLMRLGMNLGEQDIFCTSQESIGIGESYIDVIKESINDSKVIIMLISKNYMESPFCLCELGVAWASDKKMVPILVNVGFDSIEYPTTPLKTTQVSQLKSKENLISIYDDLKELNHITAKTNSFTNQLDVFMNMKLWENPVDAHVETNSDLSTTNKEVGSNSHGKILHNDVLSRLKPIKDYDLRIFEPSISKSKQSFYYPRKKWGSWK